MSNLKLDNIVFIGRDKKSDVNLINGVNVICGASDTGKSYLAEAIDYMLGGSKLRPIPEADKYDRIMLEITSGEKSYIITRSINGGDFSLINSDNINEKVEPLILNATHEHGRTDNLSGFLLEKIGLLNKKILFSSSKLTTRSLSFRNIARLVIIQEEEIQTKGSPFWDGEFTLKTS